MIQIKTIMLCIMTIIKFHFHPHTDTLQTPLELNMLKEEENNERKIQLTFPYKYNVGYYKYSGKYKKRWFKV